MRVLSQLLKAMVLMIMAFTFGCGLGERAAKAGNAFVVGQEATCLYEGVRSNFDGSEFVDTLPVTCIVLEAIVVDNEYYADYQHLKMDCTKDLDKKSSDKPGIGFVKDHKLNLKIRWFNSNDCTRYVRKD